MPCDTNDYVLGKHVWNDMFLDFIKGDKIVGTVYENVYVSSSCHSATDVLVNVLHSGVDVSWKTHDECIDIKTYAVHPYTLARKTLISSQIQTIVK